MITVTTYRTETQEWVEVEFYSVLEVAEKLAVSQSTIRRLAAAGVATPYPSGGAHHYSALDIAAFYAALTGDDATISEAPAVLPGRVVTDAELESLL